MPISGRSSQRVHARCVSRCLNGTMPWRGWRQRSIQSRMSDLSHWLALREAADWAARSERLVQRVTETLAPLDTIRALDLCTGTGSNLRYLMDRLPPRQNWLVVDRDDALLEEVPARWAQARNRSLHREASVCRIRGDGFQGDVETRRLNLARLDEALFEGRSLVTASALLDLVSESWLRTLAGRCRTAGATALFTITY